MSSSVFRYWLATIVVVVSSTIAVTNAAKAWQGDGWVRLDDPVQWETPAPVVLEPRCLPDTDQVAVEPWETRIPKRIIQTWRTKRLQGDYKAWNVQLQKKHPDFEYLLFDDREVAEFVEREFPDFYPMFLSFTGAIRVRKFDLFRFLAVYHYGGFYFDIDLDFSNPVHELLNHSAIFPFEEMIDAPLCKASLYCLRSS